MMIVQTKVPHGVQSQQVLSQVLNSFRFSLASYLQMSRPWISKQQQRLAREVTEVARGHFEAAQRIAGILIAQHNFIEAGTFPKNFTGLNDLAISFLVGKVVQDQKRRITMLQEKLSLLKYDAEAYSLVRRELQAEQDRTDVFCRESAIAISPIKAIPPQTASKAIDMQTVHRLARSGHRESNLARHARRVGLQDTFRGGRSDSVSVGAPAKVTGDATWPAEHVAKRVAGRKPGTNRRSDTRRGIDRCRPMEDAAISRWLDEGGASYKSCCHNSCE